MTANRDPSILTRAWQLQTQVQSLREMLPPTRAAQRVGAALWREGVAAYARVDIEALSRVLQKMRTLHLSLDIGAVGDRIGGRRSRQHAPGPSAQDEDPSRSPIDAPPVHHTAAGPGLPGWGPSRPQRSVPSNWRRPVAPIAYPYGEPPVPAPHRDEASHKSRPPSAPFVDPWLTRARPIAAEAAARRPMP